MESPQTLPTDLLTSNVGGIFTDFHNSLNPQALFHLSSIWEPLIREALIPAGKQGNIQKWIGWPSNTEEAWCYSWSYRWTCQFGTALCQNWPLFHMARHCVKIGRYSILFHMCKHKEPSQWLITAFPHLLLSTKTVITSCSLVAEPWRSSLWRTLPLSCWWSGPERAGRWSPPSPPRMSACCGCVCPICTAPGRRPLHGNTAQVGDDPPFLSFPKPETRRKQTEKH